MQTLLMAKHGRYGLQTDPRAQAAGPALISALSDSDAQVRNAARYALQRINPEAATNAGRK